MTPARGTPGNRHDTLAVVTGKSGKGTARQTIRVDEELWTAFGKSAEAMGGDRSAVLRDFMRWHIGEADASQPARPEPPASPPPSQ